MAKNIIVLFFFCCLDSSHTLTSKSIYTLIGKTTAKEQQAVAKHAPPFNLCIQHLNCSLPVAKCHLFSSFLFLFLLISNAVKFKRMALSDKSHRGTCGKKTELQNKAHKATPQISFILFPVSSPHRTCFHAIAGQNSFFPS